MSVAPLHGEGPTRSAIVTGAAGQDGSFLTQRLLDEGVTVHAVVRHAGSLPQGEQVGSRQGQLIVHEIDVTDIGRVSSLVNDLRPDEIYNLAGLSSVSESFRRPWATWRTNTRPVLALLEAIREHSPDTRLFQASSSEMYGGLPAATETFNERSPLLPRSPYAAAKAASHLACSAYREAFGLRIACGIMFNHESSRRPPSFLTRKVVDHVRSLGPAGTRRRVPPLRAGNLLARRDWGFAPDYVDGFIRVIRQVGVRAIVQRRTPDPDVGASYRDYVLGTGRSLAVWELIDHAFRTAGHELVWSIDDDNPKGIEAWFTGDGESAVIADESLFRPADPASIRADSSLARLELAWEPRVGPEAFLTEMFQNGSERDG